MSIPDDIYFMRMALNMARRGLGQVSPNPAVGCVLVNEEGVVAVAHTAWGGRPHAETIALGKAGFFAKGATVYVSLEPCSHQGQTGPCAQALIDAGVVRVVVACSDPDPRVSGQGVEMLKAAGVQVETGVLEEEALVLNAGFILRVMQNRPLVTLKCAVSADGKIAAEKGARTQISGEMAARYMHLQRSMHDAILIGSETYVTDRPHLTTRIEGYEHVSRRFILDRRGRLDAPDFEILTQTDIPSALEYLAEQGVTRLLVEGGAAVHRSFLEAKMVDQFQLCKSPKELGAQGVDGVTGDEIETISGLKLQKTVTLGEDTLEIYGKAA